MLPIISNQVFHDICDVFSTGTMTQMELLVSMENSLKVPLGSDSGSPTHASCLQDLRAQTTPPAPFHVEEKAEMEAGAHPPCKPQSPIAIAF